MVFDNFINNWRGTDLKRKEPEHVPKDVDLPANLYDIIHPRAFPHSALTRPRNFVKGDEDKLEAADRGTLYERRPYFGIKGLSQNKYDDFVNNKNLFGSLLVEWEEEDNPLKRRQLINRYSDRYGFKDNPIFADYIKNLEHYDDGDFRHSIGLYVDDIGPASSFSAKTRKDWRNYLNDAMKDAESRFSPYRSA